MSDAARNVTLEVCSHCGDVAGATAHGHSDAPDWRWRWVEYAPVEALRAENTRLRDALDGIVEDLSVPSRPAPWVSHALKLAQDALAQKRTQET